MPTYMIVGDAIGCIGKDRVLDLDSDPAEPLSDELQRKLASPKCIMEANITAKMHLS